MEREVIALSFGKASRRVVVDRQVAEVLHTCARVAGEEINPEGMLSELSTIPGLFSGYASPFEIAQTLEEATSRDETLRLQVVPLESYPIDGWTDSILALAGQEANGEPLRAEHLVLGILAHDMSKAAHVLRRLGDTNRLAQNMRQRLASQAA